jgi:hypothetical protein
MLIPLVLHDHQIRSFDEDPFEELQDAVEVVKIVVGRELEVETIQQIRLASKLMQSQAMRRRHRQVSLAILGRRLHLLRGYLFERRGV